MSSGERKEPRTKSLYFLGYIISELEAGSFDVVDSKTSFL